MKVRSYPLPLLTFDDHGDDPADDADGNAFVLPENLAARDDDGNLIEGAVPDERLAELEAEAMAAFDAIRGGRLNADALEQLSALTDCIESIRTEAEARIGDAQEAADAADALASRVHVPETVEGVDDTPAPEGGDPADAPTGETDPAAGDGGDPAAAPEGGDPAPVAEGGDPAPAAPAPEVVAASGRTPAVPRRRERVVVPLGAVAAAAPPPNVNGGSAGLSMVAAAELPGRTPGSEFGSTLEIAQAMHDRARHLGNGHSAPVATIERPNAHRVTDQMSLDQVQAVIAAAIHTGQLGPMNLTAAGGWCAPNQVLYDLFSMESTDGLFTLPTVTIERGGIDYPDPASVPTLRDVFGTDALWLWTEQNDIDAHTEGGDDPTKPCARIPCVEFTSSRLDAYGICLTHGNLANQGYPELTRRYLDLVMAAHEHVMSVARLAAVIAASSGVTMGNNFGATMPILSAIELQALSIRDKYRMNMGVLLEAVFPHWVLGLIRSDLGHRADSGADDLGVTDQQIVSWFTQRGVRPQFVYNWQSLETSADDETTDEVVGDGGGENGEPTQYPTELDFLMYPAGTHLWGSGGSINLLVARDSTLNATNDYTAAFTEEFHTIVTRGPESRIVTVTVDPSGQSGATDGSGATY